MEQKINNTEIDMELDELLRNILEAEEYHESLTNEERTQYYKNYCSDCYGKGTFSCAYCKCRRNDEPTRFVRK